ncbi:hypothetical protein GDO81_025350 [Engystomops pustulosus]|uniref:G-protein coupled receptors family 1 profile domain-containing protein n=1 Tax=Engystomops pustulosus TaxID=76066 RepID=A0AAV6Z4L6_ENGPU|nr:hypothetical protein GDO81_025350 [Engystomops pustulosus]
MNNESYGKYFYMLPFSEKTRGKPFITAFFFLIYVVGVVINSSIIIYHMSGVGVAEETLLFVMAYDRYVAICDPLHYNQIMSRRNCILTTIGIWAMAVLNSVMFVQSALYMSSCHSNVIHQFYCDAKSLTQVTCTTTQLFYLVNAVEILLLAFTPLTCTFISYAKIFSDIFKMKSESRKKAFSTCSSHIIVISIYYGAAIIGYFIPDHYKVLNIVFNVLYTNVIPMINPIIYSLQNSSIQSALLGLGRDIFILNKDSRKNLRVQN